MEKVIELIDISKKYKLDTNTKEVLNNVNLTINENDFIVIKGKSGSGKSSLLNILGLVDTYTSGRYLYKNRDICSMNENEKSILRNREIGFVFQSFNLINDFTVYQNVELPLKYSSIKDKKQRKRIVEKKLSDMGMLNKAEYYPYQLSGGQQQRVAIARALVNNCSLILADEPTGSLDSITGNEIIDLLFKLNKLGKIVVMVTHNEEFAKYATKIINIKDGCLYIK